MAKIKTIIIALIMAIAPALAGSANAHGAVTKPDGYNMKPTTKQMTAADLHYHEELVCAKDKKTDTMVYHYHRTFPHDYTWGKMSEFGPGHPDLLAFYIAGGPGFPSKATYFFDPTEKCKGK